MALQKSGISSNRASNRNVYFFTKAPNGAVAELANVAPRIQKRMSTLCTRLVIKKRRFTKQVSVLFASKKIVGAFAINLWQVGGDRETAATAKILSVAFFASAA